VCVCNDVYAYICICICIRIHTCLYVYTDACHILKEGLNFVLVSIKCVRV